jgi:hypothetical protein
MPGSIASVVLAFSLISAGCGGTDTHSAQEVRHAFARHGIELRPVPIEIPKEYRSIVRRQELRLTYWLAQVEYAVRTVGQRTVGGAGFSDDDDDVSVVVYAHPVSAQQWTAHLVPPIRRRIIVRGTSRSSRSTGERRLARRSPTCADSSARARATPSRSRARSDTRT